MSNCFCESECCEHHADALTCENPTTEADNTRALGNVCLPCREGYAAAGYPLHLTGHALLAQDHATRTA